MRANNVCPKCSGNVFVDRDYVTDEWYEYCLQCGYRYYLPMIVKTQQKTTKSGRARKGKQPSES
jgi:hypothetical protein